MLPSAFRKTIIKINNPTKTISPIELTIFLGFEKPSPFFLLREKERKHKLNKK